MATSKELQDRLDSLKREESELRKQISKQKRHEENELIMKIGKLAKQRFYTLETYEDFEKFFYSINVPFPTENDNKEQKIESPKIKKTESKTEDDDSVFDTTSADRNY